MEALRRRLAFLRRQRTTVIVPVADAGPPSLIPPPATALAEPAPAPRPRERGSFLVLAVAALLILWIARGVLGPFIVAAVLAYAFSPLITATERRTGWPRTVVVAVEYGIAAAVLALIGVLLAGRIGRELQELAASGPDSLATILRNVVGSDSLDIGGQQIAVADVAREIQTRINALVSAPGDAVHLAVTAGELVLQIILAIIVTFYFLVDGAMLRDRAISLLPAGQQERTREVLARIHAILGKWLRGQLLLIVLVSAVAYLALGPILHLPYALAIALLTGVLEIIPLVGPVVATAIAATDAFARGGVSLAVVVIAIYFVLRQVEDQVVMPIVIGRAVHLHPVVTIFAVLVGLSVYGVLGGLLGVPLAAALNVIFRELYPEPDSDRGLTTEAG
jgi:predicted PurR-regulated permease PerM